MNKTLNSDKSFKKIIQYDNHSTLKVRDPEPPRNHLAPGAQVTNPEVHPPVQEQLRITLLDIHWDQKVHHHQGRPHLLEIHEREVQLATVVIYRSPALHMTRHSGVSFSKNLSLKLF